VGGSEDIAWRVYSPQQGSCLMHIYNRWDQMLPVSWYKTPGANGNRQLYTCYTLVVTEKKKLSGRGDALFIFEAK